ncbi:MAG: hypothetical protein WB791_04945 [Waddliaceae bacterium]
MSTQEKEKPPLGNQITKTYTIRVNEHFFEKIDKQISILKYLEGQSQSKQRWIQEAVKEKIENEKEKDPQSIPMEKRLHFKLAKKDSEYISQRVSFVKKFRESFSQKQWLIEAIQEKLDREKIKTEKVLNDLKKSNIR